MPLFNDSDIFKNVNNLPYYITITFKSMITFKSIINCIRSTMKILQKCHSK